MSRIDNIVFVGTTFKRSREDIWDAFDANDKVYLKGES